MQAVLSKALSTELFVDTYIFWRPLQIPLDTNSCHCCSSKVLFILFITLLLGWGTWFDISWTIRQYCGAHSIKYRCAWQRLGIFSCTVSAYGFLHYFGQNYDCLCWISGNPAFSLNTVQEWKTRLSGKWSSLDIYRSSLVSSTASNGSENMPVMH